MSFAAHPRRTHALPAHPAPSLLRLSAGVRLAGAGVLIGAVWLAVLATIG